MTQSIHVELGHLTRTDSSLGIKKQDNRAAAGLKSATSTFSARAGHCRTLPRPASHRMSSFNDDSLKCNFPAQYCTDLRQFSALLSITYQNHYRRQNGLALLLILPRLPILSPCIAHIEIPHGPGYTRQYASFPVLFSTRPSPIIPRPWLLCPRVLLRPRPARTMK